MQIIDILRDQDHLSAKGLLQLSQGIMCRIGRCFCAFRTTHVVKVVHQLWVCIKAFGCCDVLDAVLGPKPVFIAKRAKSAFRGNARTGQNHDLVHGGPFMVKTRMIQRILFVCLGNICRSPAAEGVMRVQMPDLQIDSAGTSGWHVGDPPYGPMQKAAALRGVDLSDLRARAFTAQDFAAFDLIVAMDADNVAAIEALRPSQNATPVRLFTAYENGPETHVPDPYYTRDFEGALDLIERCAAGLKGQLRRQ